MTNAHFSLTIRTKASSILYGYVLRCFLEGSQQEQEQNAISTNNEATAVKKIQVNAFHI